MRHLLARSIVALGVAASPLPGLAQSYVITKSQQPPLSFGSFGTGSTPHLAGESFTAHGGVVPVDEADRPDGMGFDGPLSRPIDASVRATFFLRRERRR